MIDVGGKKEKREEKGERKRATLFIYGLAAVRCSRGQPGGWIAQPTNLERGRGQVASR